MPYKATTPRARIEHTCDACGATISPGDRYFRTDGVWTHERVPHPEYPYSDEEWLRIGGTLGEDTFVESRTDKLCAACAFDDDGNPDLCWQIGTVVSWVKHHGGTVSDWDSSYKVSRCITVPEHHWRFDVDGEEYRWGYSAGMQDSFADLLLWLSSRPSMPDISDVVLEHLVDEDARQRARELLAELCDIADNVTHAS